MQITQQVGFFKVIFTFLNLFEKKMFFLCRINVVDWIRNNKKFIIQENQSELVLIFKETQDKPQVCIFILWSDVQSCNVPNSN